MANQTECQTSGAIFHTKVESNKVSITVDLPMDLELSEKQAEILETNMHNAMELVLAPYFVNQSTQPGPVDNSQTTKSK